MNLDNIMEWFDQLSEYLQTDLINAYEIAVCEQNCNIEFDEYLLDNYPTITNYSTWTNQI